MIKVAPVGPSKRRKIMPPLVYSIMKTLNFDSEDRGKFYRTCGNYIATQNRVEMSNKQTKMLSLNEVSKPTKDLKIPTIRWDERRY